MFSSIHPTNLKKRVKTISRTLHFLNGQDIHGAIGHVLQYLFGVNRRLPRELWVALNEHKNLGKAVLNCQRIFQKNIR